MERIWLKQYPAGVPADIDVTQYGSLVELLEESFAKFRDRKAFICMDKSISFLPARPGESLAGSSPYRRWRRGDRGPHARHRGTRQSG